MFNQINEIWQFLTQPIPNSPHSGEEIGQAGSNNGELSPDKEALAKDIAKVIQKLKPSPWELFWLWTGVREKKGWDWAQLLVSISIPIVILLAGQIFTAQSNDKQQKLADAKQKDEVLKSYVESIKTLLLDKDHPMLDETQGRHSKNIAQALTFIVLRQLNDKQVNENQANERKGVLIKFLMESNLITTSSSPIVLKRCDLSDADFSAAYLGAANLIAANFMGAHLKNANFSDAILTNASLDVQGYFILKMRLSVSSPNWQQRCA